MSGLTGHQFFYEMSLVQLNNTATNLRNQIRRKSIISAAILLVFGLLSHITNAAQTSANKPRYVKFDETDGTGCYKWEDQLVSSEPNLSPRIPSYLGKQAAKVPCANRHHLETFVNMDKSKFQSLGKPFSKAKKYCLKVFDSKKKNISSATVDIQLLSVNSSGGVRRYFCTVLGENYVDEANTAYYVYKESIRPILKINMGE